MLIDGFNFPNLIVKFGKKTHLEELKSGHIYMKDFHYYRNLEQQGQGDKLEGSLYSNQYVYLDGIKLPATVIHEPDPNVKIPIFCATYINKNNASFYVLNNENFGAVVFDLDVDKIIDDFDCDYGLILEYDEFQSKIVSYCDDNKIGHDQGLVSYYDVYNDFENPWLKERINGFDVLYRKNDCYKYQNEVRWVVDKHLDKSEDHLDIYTEPFEFSELIPIEKFRSIKYIVRCYKENK